MGNRHTEVDVAVLGSGAAGLTAAIAAAEAGASVAVYEKSDLLGGTTAMSGGIVWMPNNHLMEASGAADSRADALAYLEALSLGHIDSDMAATFVDRGPEVVRFLHEHTPVEFAVLEGYPDYHPEHPGGKPDGGRSLDNDLFALPSLDEWADRIRMQKPRPVMLRETPLGGASDLPPMDLIGERMQRGESGMGLALYGALLRACLDRGIEPQTESQAEQLLLDDDGSVIGVTFSDDSQVSAGAVIIATGGFEWNAELTRTFLRGPMTAPAGAPTNTGDGLIMAMDAGARVGNMHGAWWVPVARIDGEEAWGAPQVRLILNERTRPGSLIVNRDGVRFCNEAGNYNALGGAFHQFDPARFDYPNQPCWLVFDQAHWDQYDVCGFTAQTAPAGWVVSAPTVAELAAELEIDASTLTATVDRFNQFVANGTDPDFARGTSAYDGFNGDQRLEGPFQTLGEVASGPFHAIKLESGALGTNGGPKTDTTCRVLRNAGGVIGGLYAAGNAMAAPTGMVYGGAGGTLGPALTFGWIAGEAAAAEVTG